MRRLAILPLVLATGCGCDHGVFGDPFPIRVSTASGPVIAHVAEGDSTTRTAVIDVLAPLTLLDAPDDAPPSRRCADLTLFGDSATPGELVPRAHLDLTITQFHACPDGTPGCQVGPEAAPLAIGAVIGGDAFDADAVRFDFTRSELSLFPDIAGDAAARGRLCEAQIDRPFRGGGTLALGGTFVSFPRRRISFGACLSYENGDPELTTISERGADVQMVLSTGIGVTVLSESAYERWRAVQAKDNVVVPAAADLPRGGVWQPAGLLEGGTTTIDRIALVGRDDDDRGPCRQVYAHHLLSARDCEDGDACPCSGGAKRCSVPAVLELAPATPIEVLVVADDDPTLQALRAELRPDTAEIDGILGTAVLAPTSIDIDAPDDRLLGRCEATGCIVRPAILTTDLEDRRALVDECLERAGAL